MADTPTVYTAHDNVLSGFALSALFIASGETPGGIACDSFPNTGNEIFYVKNTGSGTTVTFAQNACSYGTDHVTVDTVTGSDTTEFGPFKLSRFGSSIDVTYGDITDLKVLLIRQPVV